MNVLKNPSFFRPAPSPTSVVVLAEPRSTTKLSFPHFSRLTPNACPPPQCATPPPLVQDGSYLETLGAKFSEAVMCALAQPTGPPLPHETLGGRRPIPQGRGHALAALIASELKATQNNIHLRRAIVRILHRPLSVLLTNLSSYLLPLLTSPAFRSPPPSPQSPHLNATQLHALGIANFADELLTVFDNFNLGRDGENRADGLSSVRKGLVSFINKVTSPLIGDLRNAIIPIVEALEMLDDSQTKSMPGVRTTVVYHPSIVTLQSLIPLYARALTRYSFSELSHSALATLCISVVWKGLVALSYRVPDGPSPSRPPVEKKRRASPPTSTPTSPAGVRFNLKVTSSRPPSPVTGHVVPTPADDARALYEILSMLPRPGKGSGPTSLAKEAVDEAFEGLRALPELLDAVHAGPPCAVKDACDNVVASRLATLMQNIPTLISLPILLRAYGPTRCSSLHVMLGLTESQYRRGCLTGFSRAEECAGAIALRVVDSLKAAEDGRTVVLRWLELEMEDGEITGSH